MTQLTLPTFAGADADQQLARQIFELFAGFGIAFSRGALIRQTVANIATYLSQSGTAVTPEQVDAVVRLNPTIFARFEQNDQVIVATTKDGHALAQAPDTVHSFRQRLYEPERPLATENINNVVTLVKPVIAAPEPVQISSYWRGGRAPITPTAEVAVAAPVEQPAPEQAAPVQVVAEPVAPAKPAKEEAALPSSSIVLSDGTVVDLQLPLEQLQARFSDALQAEIKAALDDDPLKRVVHFGGYYYASDTLRPFGKNDLRRIRDFIVEQGEPLSDATIISDLYRERAGSPSFDLARFALDYRLAREKDFEFVGVADVNLWAAKGLPALGTKRVKASDLGQLYAYLQDGYDDEEDAIEGMVQHVLTVWEWEYGILPYNGTIQTILPAPLLHEQRTAVIRIESPQHYSSYTCEIRFPTGTRGGWVWGLEEFFHEYVVPGVTLTLSATEDPTVFTIQYPEAPATETKLLHLDEKRNRYAFMPVTYYAQADERLLPSQSNFNKLRNLKTLPMNERKKADLVLKHVFETVGEQLGSKDEPLYWINIDELRMAINVLRPMSRSFLEHQLGSDDLFYADETTVGAYYYKPAPEVAAEVTEEDEVGVLDYDDDEE